MEALQFFLTSENLRQVQFPRSRRFGHFLATKLGQPTLDVVIHSSRREMGKSSRAASTTITSSCSAAAQATAFIHQQRLRSQVGPRSALQDKILVLFSSGENRHQTCQTDQSNRKIFLFYEQYFFVSY